MDKENIPESITIKVCWTETDEGILFDEDSMREDFENQLEELLRNIYEHSEEWGVLNGEDVKIKCNLCDEEEDVKEYKLCEACAVEKGIKEKY